MTDFEFKINTENTTVEYTAPNGIDMETIVTGLETMISSIAERNNINKNELKLMFFMLVAKHFAGHKVFLLNHYIIQFRLRYLELKERIKWNIS